MTDDQRRRADRLEAELLRHEDKAWQRAMDRLRALGGSTVRRVVAPKRGRPPGTGMLLPSRGVILTKYEEHRRSLGRPPTKAEFESHVGVSHKTLERSLKRHDLPWPPDGSEQQPI